MRFNKTKINKVSLIVVEGKSSVTKIIVFCKKTKVFSFERMDREMSPGSFEVRKLKIQIIGFKISGNNFTL